MIRHLGYRRLVLMVVMLAHLLPWLPLAHAGTQGHLVPGAAAAEAPAMDACPHAGTAEAMPMDAGQCADSGPCCCAHSRCGVLPVLPGLNLPLARPPLPAVSAILTDLYPPVELHPPRASSRST